MIRTCLCSPLISFSHSCALVLVYLSRKKFLDTQPLTTDLWLDDEVIIQVSQTERSHRRHSELKTILLTLPGTRLRTSYPTTHGQEQLLREWEWCGKRVDQLGENSQFKSLFYNMGKYTITVSGKSSIQTIFSIISILLSIYCISPINTSHPRYILCICVYIHTHTDAHTHTLYLYGEREWEREKERERWSGRKRQYS